MGTIIILKWKSGICSIENLNNLKSPSDHQKEPEFAHNSVSTELNIELRFLTTMLWKASFVLLNQNVNISCPFLTPTSNSNLK